MEILKEDVQKAIDFLKSLAPESFVAGEQTKGFSPENIGKFHCVFGHLAVNPASPFYQKDQLSGNGTEVAYFSNRDAFPFVLNEAIVESIGGSLVQVNNTAPQEKRKEAVVEHLEKFILTLN